MPTLSLEALSHYRAGTFRLKKRLASKEEAVDFVNERGFIYFWPIREINLPSLWTATAGDRPVADAHDDPGHVTWAWKDAFLGKKVWYYAKVLRKKGTFISLQAAPYFYALTENYGSPDEDYLTLYEQGRLTLEAKQVYEALLDKGPLDTITLRKTAHLTSNGSEARFNRALSDLQADFKILPVGVTEAGAWHYAFAYDIVPRHFPELLEQARYIGELDACRKLAELYLRSVGAAQLRDLTRLFGWKPELARKTLDHGQQKGWLQGGLSLEKHPGEWFALLEVLA